MTSARRGNGGGPLRISVVLPTTRRPVFITDLKARPQLPASHVLAGGDYRPLKMSADYDQLIGAGGPIGLRLAAPARSGLPPGARQEARPAWELRLSESFETGRSCEVPVSLAHLLLARGHKLVANPSEADLVCCATGAVDPDLAIVDDTYHLDEKLQTSMATLVDATLHARVVVLLPAGSQLAATHALAELERAGVELRRVRSIDEALAHIDTGTAAATFAAGIADTASAADRPIPRPSPRFEPRRLAAGVAALLAVVGAGWGAMAWKPWARPVVMPEKKSATVVTPPVASSSPAPSSTPVPAAALPAPSKANSPVVVPVVEPAKAAAVAAAPRVEATDQGRDRAIRIEEHRAPANRTCIQLLFSGEPAAIRELSPVDGRFEPSRLRGLCRLVVKIADPGLARSIELDPGILEVTMPVVGGGATDLTRVSRVIRDGVRGPRRYQITAHRSDAAPGPREWQFAHELID